MKISILCSSGNHPINTWLVKWMAENGRDHEIELIRRKTELTSGDILFLISCSEIIGPIDRSQFKKSLVIHASDLPLGRGWSPHIWQILGGISEITVTLLEAADQVDSGRIWTQERIYIPKTALFDEINSRLFDAELRLMDFALKSFDTIEPIDQDSRIEPTYYLRRTPLDSQLDPSRSIEDQFDLIRVCDPQRFPATVQIRGKTFTVRLERHLNEED